MPSAALATLLAWIYLAYGSLPVVGRLLYGIKPVVIALVIAALWPLARKSLTRPFQIGLALAGLIFYLLGVNEVLLLLAGAGLTLLNRRLTAKPGLKMALWPLYLEMGWPVLAGRFGDLALAVASYNWLTLLTSLARTGTILLGGGYALLAYLRADFVERLGWLTPRQFLDAVAVGQVTPGPIFSVVSFIGYLVGGWAGAGIALAGLVVPSVGYVAVTLPFLSRLRRSALAAALLDGINAVTLGLIAALTVQLIPTAIVDPLTLGLAALSLAILFYFKPSPLWLIGGGALLSLLLAWL